MSDIPDEDPTKEMWEGLLRKYPGKNTRKPVTLEQRARASEKTLAYLAEHGHPKSKTKNKRQRKRIAIGKCQICQGPLYNPDHAELGVGPDCLKIGLAAGDIVIKDGKYVIKRKRK
jgi:hypothetical protein